MKTNKKDLVFGLIHEIPEDSPAAWGARTIQQDTWMDIVHDRQDLFAIDKGHMTALKTLLNEGNVLQLCQHNYRLAREKFELQSDKEGTVILYEDKAICIKADTNGSFGYVYVCAYLKPSDDNTDSEWSGKHNVPSVGDTINISMNGIGKSVVLGFDKIHGYRMARIWPLSPPEWYREQNVLPKPCRQEYSGPSFADDDYDDYEEQEEEKETAITWKPCGAFGSDLGALS